jgi:hypothetical protein
MLMERVRNLCEQYPQLEGGRYEEYIHEARHSTLTREQLRALWTESYLGPEVGRDCIDAMFDAGCDIAERWDGRAKR